MLLREVSLFAALPILYMDFEMFGARNYLEIAWRVIERITINMMYLFLGGKFAIEESFHYKAMLRLVVAFANMNVSVSILDVNTNKDFSANWLTVAAHKGIMIATQTLCPRLIIATINRARLLLAIDFSRYQWIAIFVPSFVMDSTVATSHAGFVASLNCAKHSLFRHA